VESPGAGRWVRHGFERILATGLAQCRSVSGVLGNFS
jgi:hypothetical protein